MSKFLMITAFLLTTWSCKQQNVELNDKTLTDIHVSPDALTLQVGEAKSITAQPLPANATNVSFSWHSDNTGVAAVSANGTVSGKTKGSATITVRSGNIEKAIPVTVNQPPFQITIGTTKYDIDTLAYEEISSDVKWLKFNIPEFVNGFNTFGKGLVVNMVEVDLSNADNKLEVWVAKTSRQINREGPRAMSNRNKAEFDAIGRKIAAAVNGDFFLLSSGNSTGHAHINSRPIGMEIVNGMLTQTNTISSGMDPATWPHALLVRDDGLPDYGSVSFSGQVDAHGQAFPLKEVNGFAGVGELVFFNNRSNAHITDSAFAWSPHTSTMVSLSYPQGGWRVNDRMEFTVTGINDDIASAIGKNFNGEGAVLVGNGAASGSTSKAFLSNLSIGDKVGVKMDVKLNNASISDKKLSAVGYQRVILQGGVSINTWNEAHPRTAMGYSLNRRKVYLVVVDGRRANYSAGATTGQLGDILKAFGAFTGFNFDGGGSSTIAVNGEVKNTPSDGAERAVSNGLMVTTTK
ncbi:MAG TPA: phosphodiester glycosidase family protein [Sphingobacterium sp.]|nr:phosphodiester glycosidase family protein [Sphingobacterium sp.]